MFAIGVLGTCESFDTINFCREFTIYFKGIFMLDVMIVIVGEIIL